MKSAVSWSIEGVAPQARESAREAARRAGLSVGEWLNTAIIGSAAHNELSPSGQGNEGSGRVAESIARLSERLEQMMDERSAAGSVPGDDHWAFGIDSAVAEIAARQRTLEDGAMADLDRSGAATQFSPDAVFGLEQHLRHISGQIETLRRPTSLEGEVGSMRRDLADIKRTLAQALPRCAVEVLEDQIRTLSDRVEHGREGADGVALASVELRLARVCDALNRLAPAENLAGLQDEVSALSHKIDTVAAQGTDSNTMEQLEAAILELRRVSERVASGDVLTKLANEVRSVSDKVDRFETTTVAGTDAVSALERRMEVLAGTLTEYATNVGQRAMPDVEVLAQTVTERLERLQSARAEHAAVEQLESHIVRLTEKLDASDSRMAQLSGLERTLADLFLQVEDTRAGAIEAAERAAKAASRDFTTLEAGDQIAVEMLKRDLTQLRESQSESDLRTQETLQAVHAAVQRIVDRIADGDIRPADTLGKVPADGQALWRPGQERTGSVFDRAPPIASPKAAVPPTASRAALQAMPVEPQTPPSSVPATMPLGSLGDRRPIDPSLPADTPLEPGSAGRGRPGATAAERIAASEAALGPAKPEAPARTEKANFIAAARRAAQAAAADAAATHTQDDAAPETQTGGLAQVLGRHKRTTLMAVAAAVVVAGAAAFGPGYLKMLDAPRLEASQARDVVASNEADAPLAETTTLAPQAAPSMQAGPQAASSVQVASRIPALAAFQPTAAPINFTGDVTGSVAVPRAPSAFAPATTASLMTPPPVAPLDAGKLPVSIGSLSLRTAAANGDPAAAYEIALRFAEGRGVPLSLDDAARWFRRAADHDIAPAQYRLGSLYEKGHGLKKDLEAARRLYTAAAGKGNAKAMHNLAVLYAEGIDGKPDYRIASDWFRKAAERGVADSQYNLGILFARGIGMEQNLAESYKWFTLAAQQGDVDAGRKRDDVATRLDAPALAAAKLAAQTFTPVPQPDEATSVKAPPGGWDRPAAATTTAPAAKTRSAARKVGSL